MPPCLRNAWPRPTPAAGWSTRAGREARRIVDAIHSGELADATTEYENFDVFNLTIPKNIEGVPREILNPRLAWKDKGAFQREVVKLATMFQKAFRAYENDVEEPVRMSGPQF